jgi:hypothetical protein
MVKGERGLFVRIGCCDEFMMIVDIYLPIYDDDVEGWMDGSNGWVWRRYLAYTQKRMVEDMNGHVCSDDSREDT